MATFSDDFNRPYEATLTGWFNIANTWAVSASQAAPDTSATFAVYDSACASDDNWSQVTVATWSSTGNVGVHCRGARSTTANGYYWVMSPSTDLIKLQKIVAGTFTDIGSSYSVAESAGMVLKIEASGSTITGYLDGVQRAQTTDTSVASGTYVGMRGAISTTRVDDWSGGDLSSGTPGTFTTTVGNADAAGGASAFTGAAEFVTAAATADAVGGTSSFTGGAAFTALAGSATAAGGATSMTGEGAFATTAGNADAAGGVSFMGVIAVFDTVVGTATAEGGSSAMTGAADLVTVAGFATAAGGVGSMVGDPTPTSFDTIVGEAWALGGVSSFDVAVVRYTFRPPSVRMGSAGDEGRLFSFYKRLHGVCLLVAGATVTERMVPSTDELDAADAYYLGGHEYEIGAPEASVLIGAGYGALLAPTPDIYADEYEESY